MGLPIDGPEEKLDQEVGYLDNAVDRERKRNAAAARERYHKMTPEERCARNQKRRAKDVADDVGIHNVPREEANKKKCNGDGMNQKPPRNQKVSPKEATKKRNAQTTSEFAAQNPAKKVTRYQRMNFDERKTFNRKKTDAKRARKEQVEREEKKEEEELNDPFLDSSYFMKLQRSSSVQEEDDENQMPLEGNDAFNAIVAKYN